MQPPANIGGPAVVTAEPRSLSNRHRPAKQSIVASSAPDQAWHGARAELPRVGGSDKCQTDPGHRGDCKEKATRRTKPSDT